MAELLVPISPGELIDKITILEIKSQRMSDPAKLQNVRTELAHAQRDVVGVARSRPPTSAPSGGACARSTRALWDIEDDIRDKERDGQFDARVHRAGARGLRDQRRARGDQAPHQHKARFGAGGREELRRLPEEVTAHFFSVYSALQ